MTDNQLCHIRLPVKLWKKINHMAIDQNKSMNQLIKEILIEAVKKPLKDKKIK